jgi:hypothetical protein
MPSWPEFTLPGLSSACTVRAPWPLRLPLITWLLPAAGQALLALQAAITNVGKSRVSSWRSLGNPCNPKPWAHVTCGGGRVVTLELPNMGVVGTLPAKLNWLNQLATLNLQGNK